MNENKKCPDCSVTPGKPHENSCNVALCLDSGGKRLFCDCGECGMDVWTGLWPGIAECREYGWYCEFGLKGWVACDEDNLHATEHLNRLVTECEWDKKLKRFIKKDSK